jgi:hypothetical protein
MRNKAKAKHKHKYTEYCGDTTIEKKGVDYPAKTMACLCGATITVAK